MNKNLKILKYIEVLLEHLALAYSPAWPGESGPDGFLKINFNSKLVSKINVDIFYAIVPNHTPNVVMSSW